MKKVTGLLAAALLVTGGAYAGGDKMHDDKNKQTQTQPQQQGSTYSTGGSAQAGGQMEQEVTGEVIKRNGNTIYVEHMGAVLPLEVDKSTRFEGQGLSKKQDLQKGQQIRAKVSVKNEIRNVASSIELKSSGTGGSGELESDTGATGDVGAGSGDLGTPSDSPDQATPPIQPADPGMGQEPGTGGSGSVEMESDTSAGTGGSSDEEASGATQQQVPESGTPTPEK